MGGRGSGRHWRWDSKTTIEKTKRIDIRYMKNQGMLRPGYIGILSWSCGNRPTGFINFRTHHDRLVLSYRYRQYGGEWEDVEETVWLDRTVCNYGGQRAWFRCPGCRRRIAVLCSDGKWFLCRHCYQLPYSSQMESYHDRMMEQARKIRRRVGATEVMFDRIYPWDKPKGMHWKTFDRLRRKEQEYRVAMFASLAGQLGLK